jgi:hypothetical protein
METEDRAHVAQMVFFQQIRDKLPAHISLVDEMEELLEISQDSSYRRIRGEKELSFGEMQKLVSHFGVSADLAFNVASENVVSFKYNPLNNSAFNLKDYITSAYDNVRAISDKAGSQMIYAAKDMPLYHFFMFDEIAAFKLFVWQKTLLGFPGFEDKYFSLAQADTELLATGKKFLRECNQFPTTELWSEETLNSLLRQVAFYCEAKLFDDIKEANIILGRIEEYIEHLRKQAEAGVKISIGAEPKKMAPFTMYHNEVFLCDNTIQITNGEKRTTFLTHNSINFLTTTNNKFCNTTNEWFTNLVKRSSLISSSSEKPRNQFFDKLHSRLRQTKDSVRYMVGN